MFFNTGDGVAEGEEIALEGVSECSEGGDLGLERDQCARFGRPPHPACGEQLLFTEPRPRAGQIRLPS